MTSDAPATTDAFIHCGGCGAADLRHDDSAVVCKRCGWCFYTNVAAAAAVLLQHNDQLLLVRRQRDPSAGRLGIPGGFVDPGESAAQAVCREVREELRVELQPADLCYLTTAPNVYPYRGVTYRSLDTYFTAELRDMPTWFDRREITGVELHDPVALDPADLAFDATRVAVAAYRRRHA